MKNTIITIALVVVLGTVVFWYLSRQNNSAEYLITDVSSTESVDAKYIYNILQKMAQVTLDNKIFTNQIFQNLKDNTVSFSPQAAGRNNPFAPIGSDSQEQTIQATTSSIKAR